MDDFDDLMALDKSDLVKNLLEARDAYEDLKRDNVRIEDDLNMAELKIDDLKERLGAAKGEFLEMTDEITNLVDENERLRLELERFREEDEEEQRDWEDYIATREEAYLWWRKQ